MSKFTMSVIARTAFAADVNVFDEEEDPLIKNSRELFDLFRDKKNLGILFMRKKIKILYNNSGLNNF